MASLMVDPKGDLYIVESELTGKVHVPSPKLVPDVVYWLKVGKAFIEPPDGATTLWNGAATKVDNQSFMDMIPTRK